MKGRYIYPHCGSLNLDVTCYLRNTARNSAKNPLDANITIDLRVYDCGEMVFEKLNYTVLSSGGFASIKLSELGFDFNPKHNYVVTADCTKGDAADFSYFAQEHQIAYETENGQRASLLYDHQPAFPRKGKYSQIIVLAPKILLSDELNTYVVFANYREENDVREQKEPLEISVLDEAGKVVLRHKEHLLFNSVYVFDVKKHLDGLVLGKTPQFFNFTAKSGESVYSIFTIIRNEATKNIAIEHSLPPGYYVSGDKTRIRDEALKFA